MAPQLIVLKDVGGAKVYLKSLNCIFLWSLNHRGKKAFDDIRSIGHAADKRATSRGNDFQSTLYFSLHPQWCRSLVAEFHKRFYWDIWWWPQSNGCTVLRCIMPFLCWAELLVSVTSVIFYPALNLFHSWFTSITRLLPVTTTGSRIFH